MTLSREEYIARAADARIRSCGLDPEKVQERLRADFVFDATVYLDAVGAYETYLIACRTAQHFEDTDAPLGFSAAVAIQAAEGTEDQR